MESDMIRERLRKLNILDLLLALGAFAFLTVYAVQGYRIEQGSGSEKALGHVTFGITQRKLLGNVSFSSIEAGATIYNRDVLWVQDAPWLGIRFQDSSTLKVRQGSMIVISRSLYGG